MLVVDFVVVVVIRSAGGNGVITSGSDGMSVSSLSLFGAHSAPGHGVQHLPASAGGQLARPGRAEHLRRSDGCQPEAEFICIEGACSSSTLALNGRTVDEFAEARAR